MTAALLLVSSLLQAGVALIALRAPRSARTRAAWWLFAAALLLMALGRLVALGGFLAGWVPSPTRSFEEGISLATSLALLVGVLRMRRLWKDADDALDQATERERAMRESEELWQRVFEFAPDGYILLALDGRLEKLNRAAAEIAGIAREHLEGRSILEIGLLDDEGIAQAVRNLGIMRSGGDPGPAEYTFHREDGSTRQVEIVGYTIEWHGQALLLTIVHDITRRRRIEGELRRSRLRLEEAQRVAGVVTFEIDLRAGTMWVSNDTRNSHGNSEGRTMSLEEGFDFIVAEDRERVIGEMASSTAKGAPNEIVVEYRQYDVLRGREALVRTTALTEADADGNVVRLIGATFDITDIRRAEQEIRTLNTELEQRVRARTSELERAVDELEAFSYSVSHDLRSPLRAMAGYSDMVLEEAGGCLSETSRSHLERIRASSVRMASLIDGLLSLSRLTRAARVDRPVDLSEMARGIVVELRNEDPGRHVDVVIEEGLHTVADAGMMQLLLQNLFANAWKFTRNAARPRIEFGCNRSAGAFYVRDNGVGFDSAQRAKLFRPFERLHRTDEFEGTGIGLATVARIVRRHGGRAWAESSVNRGATFWFTLNAGA